MFKLLRQAVFSFLCQNSSVVCYYVGFAVSYGCLEATGANLTRHWMSRRPIGLDAWKDAKGRFIEID